MKKYIVKAYEGYAGGWRTIKVFKNPKEADEWLINFVRIHGYWMTDFTIVAKED